jgi:hypothetical protein
MPRATADALTGVLAAVVATIAFIVWRDGHTHWASALPGHLMGVAGIVLMLWASVGYSWRKRHIAAGTQSMQMALHLHIVAGLVGPYLVILHSGLAFRGVAGVLTLATVLVVASGVVGRALMSMVPTKITLADPIRAALLDAELARLETREAELLRAPVQDIAARDALRVQMLSVRHEQELVHTQWTQSARTGAVRRAMSAWWYLHVPLTAALWVLAVTHVVAAVYFTWSA